MMIPIAIAAIVIVFILGTIFMVTGTIKRCPACGATAAAPTGREGPHRFYSCNACKVELVSDSGRALERREHWVPGEPPLPPPTATLRG